VRVGCATLSGGKRKLAAFAYGNSYGDGCICVRGVPPLNPPRKPTTTGKMAIAYAEVNTIQRTPTTNLVAGVAYIVRGRFVDGNSGKIYDYSKVKDPPEFFKTFMPANSRYQNESELWSDAERLERRQDSRLGRRLILALPAEVSPKERQQIVEGIAEKIVERWGCAVTVAVHRPGKQGDQRNFHAHFLISTRKFNQDGFLKEKIRILDNPRTSRGEIEWLRQTCQEQINKFLSPEQQLDFRSYKRQGKDRLAQPHYGRKVVAWERKTGEKHEVRLEYEQFASNWNRQRELERQVELERQRQQQELERQAELERQRAEQERRQAELERQQAEYQKKYSYFAATKKLINRYKNPQIGTDQEGTISLPPDQTLKFSELNSYSLESLQEVYQTTRRKIERDLDRRIGQLPPIAQQIIGLRPLKELPDESLIGLFPTVLQLEQSKQEEQQKQEAERKRLEQELERRRLEQERQRQQQEQKRQAERERREQEELARKKRQVFYFTQKLVSRLGNPQIGLDTEKEIILPDKKLKLSELKDYSLEFLEQSFLRVRRQVEEDLSRRISQLPPEMRELLTHPHQIREIEKIEITNLINFITEVKSLEILAQEEQERQREEQERRQADRERQRAEQEKLRQGQGLPKKRDPLERLREKLEQRRQIQQPVDPPTTQKPQQDKKKRTRRGLELD
jgi:hypothetical protein